MTSHARRHRAPGSDRPHGPRVGWVAHAGLAAYRTGGTPTRDSLSRAVSLGVDWVEVDVCVTGDGRLVLRHDVRLPDGVPLVALTLTELRRADRDLLTLDEAVDAVGSRTRLLLDIKLAAAAPPLGRWLGRRRTTDALAVCTESRSALLSVREQAPRVARWLSLPDVGSRRPEHVACVLRDLSHHRHPGQMTRALADLARAVAEMRQSPEAGVARLCNVPWRVPLPQRLGLLAADVGAAALCVHHWLVTPQLCESAHRLGLPVVAWTINRPHRARQVLGCGVDLITTDDVVGVRDGLHEATPRRTLTRAAVAG